jgi:NAD(P)H dehydrogenase (quinone)
MRAVVVHAHPSASSFSAALRFAAVDGLIAAGHEVRVHDLYSEGFAIAMSTDERRAYHSGTPILDPVVRRYADDIAWCDTLVFVYPTWWMTLPPIMKAWLERVLVPGVAFDFDEAGKVRSQLTNVTRIIGISTYGADRRYVRLMTDGGRRTLTRALRISCGLRTRSRWIALYSVPKRSDAERAAFIAHVKREVAR